MIKCEEITELGRNYWSSCRVYCQFFAFQKISMQSKGFSLLQRIPGCTAEEEEQEIESFEDEGGDEFCIAQDLLDTVGQD